MNSSRRLDFSDVRLYAVTMESLDDQALIRQCEGLLAGGVDALQLRAKNRTDQNLFKLGSELKELCSRFGALFLLNNRVDMALALDADGVHLGHEDLPLPAARHLLGHRKIIGASTHSIPEALTAQRNGADYVSCGPLWATPTKPDYKPVGLDLAGLYNAALKVPFVAIGGIDKGNIDAVIEAGAKRAAIVRALFETPTPEQDAKFFKDKITAGAAVKA